MTLEGPYLAFLNRDVDPRTVCIDRVRALTSTNILQAGAVIAAWHQVGLRSDLPEQVIENVYYSPTG